jgi:hypothetical protein
MVLVAIKVRVVEDDAVDRNAVFVEVVGQRTQISLINNGWMITSSKTPDDPFDETVMVLDLVDEGERGLSRLTMAKTASARTTTTAPISNVFKRSDTFLMRSLID